MEWFEAFFGSGIRFTTPILLAALGGLFTAWTRDLNVGLEGAMIFGAFFGVMIGLNSESWVMAVVLTTFLGVMSGLIFGYIVAELKVNVFVAGIALNVLGAGGTVYLLRSLFGVKGTLSGENVPSIPRVDLPVISEIPFFGPILSGHTVLTYFSWVLVAFLIWAVHGTKLVRHLKASGEHPAALATAGGKVNGMRIFAQAWCFALCALAGVQLSLGQLSLFTEGMTSGIGFVALAAVIFSRGRVPLLAIMCFGFGLSSAASVVISDDIIPPQFAQMTPYVVAMIGLIIFARTSKGSAMRIATPVMDKL
jgi:ABC-type uncharacterized transport system permease subunit